MKNLMAAIAALLFFGTLATPTQANLTFGNDGKVTTAYQGDGRGAIRTTHRRAHKVRAARGSSKARQAAIRADKASTTTPSPQPAISNEYEGEPPRAASTNDDAPAPDLVAAMRKDLGKNPTGWGRLWCAKYLNMVLARLGLPQLRGDDRNMARAFRRYGTPATPGTRNAIVVRPHHVAVATGRSCDRYGRGRGVETISGNSTGRRVAFNCESKSSIIAWRMPARRVTRLE